MTQKLEELMDRHVVTLDIWKTAVDGGDAYWDQKDQRDLELQMQGLRVGNEEQKGNNEHAAGVVAGDDAHQANTELNLQMQRLDIGNEQGGNE